MTVIDTDGEPTVSSPAPRGGPPPADWASGGHEAFGVPVRDAHEECRIAYAGGGHSMAMSRERAERYLDKPPGSGHVLERRTVTDWERDKPSEEGQ